jgi:hypothetical protein
MNESERLAAELAESELLACTDRLAVARMRHERLNTVGSGMALSVAIADRLRARHALGDRASTRWAR